MKFIILSLFFSLSINAKIIKGIEPESKYMINCMQGFIHNPVVQEANPSFWKNFGKHENEVIDYCSCTDKALKYEHDLAKKDYFTYLFRNKQQELLKKDNCAIKTISKEWYSVFYRSRMVLFFEPFLKNKIIEIIPTAYMQKVLGENSEKLYNYHQCLMMGTAYGCDKTQSLGVTYQCLKQNLDIENFDKVNRSCIHILEVQDKESIPEHYLIESKQMTI